MDVELKEVDAEAVTEADAEAIAEAGAAVAVVMTVAAVAATAEAAAVIVVAVVVRRVVVAWHRFLTSSATPHFSLITLSSHSRPSRSNATKQLCWRTTATRSTARLALSVV